MLSRGHSVIELKLSDLTDMSFTQSLTVLLTGAQQQIIVTRPAESLFFIGSLALLLRSLHGPI